MITTLTGNNTYAMKRRLDELAGAFVAKYGELALERIDAEEAEADAILESIQSLPFLAESKMVVVRSLSANKAAAEQIEQIISSSDKATSLILYEPLTDKRTVYYKTLKAKTSFEEYDELAPQELPKWLISEAKKQIAELSFADAKYLVDRVGANQELLANELAKLIAYDPKISKSSIDLLTEPTPQSKIFELLDAAFAGKKARALELYDEQRTQKIEPQAILAMIAWQLQLIALAKNAGTRSPSGIAKESGINEYPIRKAAGLAAKTDENRLRKLVEDALNMDWLNKTSSLDIDEALKTYIVTI
jgi:DNA polymerase-3 subunit delta